MTAQLAPRSGVEPTEKSRLRAVARTNDRVATVPFVLILAAVLALGMVGMVVLSTALQDQAFAVQSRQHAASVLSDRVSQLESEVADARSIRSVAIAAEKLGMRPDPNAVPMRLSDGKLYGKARVATGNEVPDVRYLTPEQAAARVAALNRAEAARIAKQKAAAAAKKAAAVKKAAAKKAAASTSRPAPNGNQQ